MCSMSPEVQTYPLKVSGLLPSEDTVVVSKEVAKQPHLGSFLSHLAQFANVFVATEGLKGS